MTEKTITTLEYFFISKMGNIIVSKSVCSKRLQTMRVCVCAEVVSDSTTNDKKKKIMMLYSTEKGIVKSNVPPQQNI